MTAPDRPPPGDLAGDLAGDLLVVLPTVLEPAFRLAGTRTAAAADAERAQQLVQAELAAGAPGVVAVHPDLWERVPAPVRADWERRLVPLVVPLPADTGRVTPGRQRAVLDLLARSVGYEITFTTQGGSR
jgi:vacuolar-type H+-ATPase subunit F/Vma7